MKKVWEYLKQRQTLSNLLVILCGIAFYMLLSRFPAVRTFIAGLLDVIAPLIWGAAIAYLVYPIVAFFENKLFGKFKHRKAAHVISALLALILVVALLVLLIVAIIPQLISSGRVLFENLPDYFGSFKETLIRWTAGLDFINLDIDGLVGTWEELFTSITDWVMANLDGILGASYKVGTSVVDFLLALVLSIYLLLDTDRLKRSFRRWNRSILKPASYDRLCVVANRSHRIFTRFIGGNLLDSLIIGVATFIFMMIMGMPYALLISFLAGVTNLIPTFGPIIGAVPCLLILLIVRPIDALWYLIFVVVIQMLDASLIKPLLFGDSTGLRPLWVLGSIIICGRLFGLVGMLLGIPVFAVISSLVEDGIQRRLNRRGLDNEGLNADSPEDVPPGEPPEPPDKK